MIIAYYISGLLKTTLLFIFSLLSLAFFMSNLSNFIKVFFSSIIYIWFMLIYNPNLVFDLCLTQMPVVQLL